MTQQEPLSREQIAELLRGETFGYQNIALPHGLSTGGPSRTETADRIFNERLNRESVLDIGCKFGYFCFVAEERGASNVLGVDIFENNIRKSRLLAQIRQSNVRFEHLDIETDNIEGQYDIVLCLNVLHHTRNPLNVLDKLIAATKKTLVLELAGSSHCDRQKNNLPLWLAALLFRLPLLYLAPRSERTFYITAACAKEYLLGKRADFAHVEIVRVGHRGRQLLIAHRRRVRKLVVVAGFPAAGKSTLIRHLTSPEGEGIARQIGFDPSLEWNVVSLGKTMHRRFPEADMGNVILHYNINKRMVHGSLYIHSRMLSDFMSIADEVVAVTLLCLRERLIQQYTEHRANVPANATKSYQKKAGKILAFYNNEKELEFYRDEWFAFVERCGIVHYVLRHVGTGYAVDQSAANIDPVEVRSGIEA